MIRIVALLWLICGLGTSFSYGQEIVARLDLRKRDPKPAFYEYCPADGGLVTLGPTSTHSTRYLGIIKYDADLKRSWGKEVIEQNGRKNVDFVSVIGEQILVFVSEFFPKEKVIKTYYYSFDLEGNTLAEEAILSIVPNQKEQKVDLQYTLSPNKKSLLCFKNLENKREAEKILYYLFDARDGYVSNGEIELKYPDNRFEMRSLRVSNAGNIFILGRFYWEKRVRDSDDYQYLIYSWNIDQQRGSEIPVKLGDQYITDLAFRLDRDENIYLGGFYSNRSTDEIGGTLLQKITPSGEVSMQATQPFGESFLRNYLSSSQIGRGRELRNFYLDPLGGIVLRSDGGVLLIAEKFYVNTISYRDMYGAWMERKVFHYDDVILTSVSPTGQIEWHAIVDKMQQGENPATLSYFNAVGSNGVYIFYEYKPRRNGINVYYNVVGIEGQVSSRIPLLPDYQFGNEYYPRFSEQINSKEALMVYLQNRGKVLSVVKVAFPG